MPEDQTLDMLRKHVNETLERVFTDPHAIYTVPFSDLTPYLLLKILEKLEQINTRLEHIEEQLDNLNPHSSGETPFR